MNEDAKIVICRVLQNLVLGGVGSTKPRLREDNGLEEL